MSDHQHEYNSPDVDPLIELFHELRPGIAHTLQRMLRNEEDVEDALSQTVVNLYRRPPLDHPNPEAWLCTVARNAALDILRRREREQARRKKLESEIDVQKQLSESLVPDPVDRERAFEVLRSCMAALAERDATWFNVVRLRYVDELDHESTAEELGLTSDQLRNFRRSALGFLERCLAKKGFTMDDIR